MERIILCIFNLGTYEQAIHLITSVGTKTIGYANLEDLPWMLVNSCENYDATRIQLYGCDPYLQPIVDEIRKLNNKIEIGVN